MPGTVEVECNGKGFTAEVADSVVGKMLGLRFRSSGKMLFRFRRGRRPVIDTFFVPETLHLYFLDAGKDVVETAEITPYRVYRPSSRCLYLLESFEPLPIEPGDRLEFQF